MCVICLFLPACAALQKAARPPPISYRASAPLPRPPWRPWLSSRWTRGECSSGAATAAAGASAVAAVSLLTQELRQSRRLPDAIARRCAHAAVIIGFLAARLSAAGSRALLRCRCAEALAGLLAAVLASPSSSLNALGAERIAGSCALGLRALAAKACSGTGSADFSDDAEGGSAGRSCGWKALHDKLQPLLAACSQEELQGEAPLLSARLAMAATWQTDAVEMAAAAPADAAASEAPGQQQQLQQQAADGCAAPANDADAGADPSAGLIKVCCTLFGGRCSTWGASCQHDVTCLRHTHAQQHCNSCFSVLQATQAC